MQEHFYSFHSIFKFSTGVIKTGVTCNFLMAIHTKFDSHVYGAIQEYLPERFCKEPIPLFPPLHVKEPSC